MVGQVTGSLRGASIVLRGGEVPVIIAAAVGGDGQLFVFVRWHGGFWYVGGKVGRNWVEAGRNIGEQERSLYRLHESHKCFVKEYETKRDCKN